MHTSYINNSSLHDPDTRFEALFQGYFSGSLNREEKTELFTGLHGRPERMERFRQTAKLHALASVPYLDCEADNAYNHFKANLYHLPQKTMHRKRNLLLACAAALIMLLTVSTVILFIQNQHYETTLQANSRQEITVPWGSMTRITLSDGTKVSLRAGSILKYPAIFESKERLVSLVGEGFFEVAKDKGKPFVVESGDTKVTVTGTSFNLRSYPEEKLTLVELIEGSVDFSANGQTISMLPNEKVTYNWQNKHIRQEKCDTHRAALWVDGKICFINAPLTDILKDVERKFDIQIHISSQKAKKETFSGTINEKMTLQEILNFIDVDNKYVFEAHNGMIVMSDR